MGAVRCGVSVIYGIGKSTALKALTEQLNMKRVCARWVPRVLTNEDRENAVLYPKLFLGNRDLREEIFLF